MAGGYIGFWIGKDINEAERQFFIYLSSPTYLYIYLYLYTYRGRSLLRNNELNHTKWTNNKKKVEKIVQVKYRKMFKSITGKERKKMLLITLKTDND